MRSFLSKRRKATPEDARRWIDQAFTDRIAFVAARRLLVAVTIDSGVNGLDPVLRDRINRFLMNHPAPQIDGESGLLHPPT